jgi:hypothetical protein
MTVEGAHRLTQVNAKWPLPFDLTKNGRASMTYSLRNMQSELPCQFSIESQLPLSADLVWDRVSNMHGVNAELMPWVRMTISKEAKGLSFQDAPVGKPLFRSWIMVGGFLPIDLHHFFLEAAEHGHFRERSSSWLQAVWCHERWVTATPTGCRVTDKLAFQPRLPLIGGMVTFIIRWVFEHRHRRLLRWGQQAKL